MDARAVHRVRDPRRIPDDGEAGRCEGRQVVPVRDRAGDRLRAPRDVDAEPPAEGDRRGVSVDGPAGPDVHTIALREDPGVASLVHPAHEQQEEVRVEDRHVFPAEAVLVRDDLLQGPHEAGLSRGQARGPIGADDHAGVEGLAVRLDAPATVVPRDRRHPRRGPQGRAVIDRVVDDPSIERGPVERVSGQSRDVKPFAVRGDAFRSRDFLGDPFLPRLESVRPETELAHAFGALHRLADDFLLVEDRRPVAGRGELSGRHASGGAGPDDDRVEHVPSRGGRGYFGLMPWPPPGIARRGPRRGPSCDRRRAGRRGGGRAPAAS